MTGMGNTLSVDGRIKAEQGVEPGDVVVLGTGSKIPAEMLPEAGGGSSTETFNTLFDAMSSLELGDVIAGSGRSSINYVFLYLTGVCTLKTETEIEVSCGGCLERANISATVTKAEIIRYLRLEIGNPRNQVQIHTVDFTNVESTISLDYGDTGPYVVTHVGTGGGSLTS